MIVLGMALLALAVGVLGTLAWLWRPRNATYKPLKRPEATPGQPLDLDLPIETEKALKQLKEDPRFKGRTEEQLDKAAREIAVKALHLLGKNPMQ